MEVSDAVLCNECTALKLQRSDFESAPPGNEERSNRPILKDTIQNLHRKQLVCSLCHLFWEALLKNERSQPWILQDVQDWEVSWSQNTMEYVVADQRDELALGSALWPKISHTDGYSNYCIQLIDDASTKSLLRGRQVPSQVDSSMLRAWVKRCEDEHGPNCRDVGLEPPVHPLLQFDAFYIIDVDRLCLCELPPGAEYIVLSYVWGTKRVPSTLISNFDLHKIPGSLNGILAQTVADAVAATRALGQKYLWVDSLCIIQDHPMKQKLISGMDAVYMHAYLCIVAATGKDVNSGLSGWTTTTDRQNMRSVCHIAPDVRLGILSFLDRELMESDHAQRAWTFQEGALSTRCLVFLNSMVHFCCRAAIWREDVHAEVPNHITLETGANTLARTLDDAYLRRYHQFVAAYTSRKLTYQSDAIDAFLGIQKALARSMDNTRFWHGMPASVFDWAVLWSAGEGVSLKRRCGFPSYSWSGWEGYIVLATDHYSEFDYQWLVSRTWIRWYIRDLGGQFVLLWDPIRDETARTNAQVEQTSVKNDANPASDTIGKRMYDNEQSDFEVGESDSMMGDDLDVDVDDAEDGVDGDESEDGDEDDEVEFCPQYGWPTNADPYGRSSAHALSIPALREPTPTLSQRSLLYFKPGTLRFETYAAFYTLDSNNKSADIKPEAHDGSEASYYILLDYHDRPCGIVWKHDSHPESERSREVAQRVKILILSYAAPGTKHGFNALKLMFQAPYEASKRCDGTDGLFWAHDEWHSWDMLNIMLVIPTSGTVEGSPSPLPRTYERHGVGVLHKEALSFALSGVVWEQIYLY